MKELDYKFIMGYLYDETITMQEISDSVMDAVAHTEINGVSYALDQAGVASYNRYKDSLSAQTYYLACASNVPYALLYDAIVVPIQKGDCVDSIFLEDIFIRSLFDSDIHAAVCSCQDYDPRIFACVEPVYTASGKEIHVGDVISIKKTEAVLQYGNTYYVHMHDTESDMHSLRSLSVNVLTRIMNTEVLTRTNDTKVIYAELIADVLSHHKMNPRVSVSDMTKRILEQLGIQNKTSPEMCVKCYYKEVSKLESTIRTSIS